MTSPVQDKQEEREAAKPSDRINEPNEVGSVTVSRTAAGEREEMEPHATVLSSVTDIPETIAHLKTESSLPLGPNEIQISDSIDKEKDTLASFTVSSEERDSSQTEPSKYVSMDLNKQSLTPSSTEGSSAPLPTEPLTTKSPTTMEDSSSTSGGGEFSETPIEKGNLVSSTQPTLKPQSESDSVTTVPQHSKNLSSPDNCLAPLDGRATTDKIANATNTTTNNATSDETRGGEGTQGNDDEVIQQKLVSDVEPLVQADEDNNVLSSDTDNSPTTAMADNSSVSNASVALPVSDISTADPPSSETVGLSTNSSSVPTTDEGDGGSTDGSGHMPATREKSVFVRLSNRINALEVNMTLFGSYLDQISQSLKRNKNRTEDMQKTLEKRIAILNETVQSMRGQVHMNVSLFEDMLTQLNDLHQSFLTHSQEWNALTNCVVILLVIVVSVQSLALLTFCCLYKRSRIEGSVSQLREEIRRLNVALVQCQDIKTIDFETGNHHFHASRQTNGVSGGKRMTDELKGTLPTTLASSDSNPSGGLFSSSSPSLISCSTSVSSSVELEAKDIDNCKWQKVEHKKRRKSMTSFKKPEC